MVLPSLPPIIDLFITHSTHIGLDAGLVGLVLTYSISLTGIFQFCVRKSTELETMVILSF